MVKYSIKVTLFVQKLKLTTKTNKSQTDSHVFFLILINTEMKTQIKIILFTKLCLMILIIVRLQYV